MAEDAEPIFDRAEDLAAHLRDVPGLGQSVVVDKQAELANKVREKLNMAAGLSVVVGFAGADVPKAEARGPRLLARYNVALFAKPILERGQHPANVVLVKLLRAMHHWEHDEQSPTRLHTRLEVQGVDLVTSQKWFSYVIRATSVVQL